MPPTPGLRGGDLTWDPSRLPGLEWVGQMPSAPLPLFPVVSSHLPLLISLASLLCSQGLMWPGGGFGGQGTSLGTQQTPQAQVCGAVALHSSPTLSRGPLMPVSPDLSDLPPMSPGPMWLGWPWRAGNWPGSPAGFLGSSGQGKCPLLFSRSSRCATPTCLS